MAIIYFGNAKNNKPIEYVLCSGDTAQTNPIRDYAPSAEDFKRGNGNALKIFKQMDD